MSKRAMVLGWAAALLATTQVAMAADIEPPIEDFSSWYFSVTGGLNRIFETELNDNPIAEGEIDFDYGFRGGAAIGRYWDEHWRTEIEFAFSSTDADDFDPDGGGGDFSIDGTLDIFSLLAKVDYEMEFFGWWHPYIGVGAGAAVISADEIGGGPPLDGDDTVFAGAVEAGSKFIITDNVEIFSQSQLLIMSDAEIEFQGTSIEGTLEMPIAWSSSLGLRLRF